MNESTSLFLTEIFDFNKKILATAQMNTIYFEKMQLYPSSQSTCMQNMEFFYWEQVRLWSKFSTFETEFKWQPLSNKPWVCHIFRFLFEFRPTPTGMISFQKRMASLLDSLNLFIFCIFSNFRNIWFSLFLMYFFLIWALLIVCLISHLYYSGYIPANDSHSSRKICMTYLRKQLF